MADTDPSSIAENFGSFSNCWLVRQENLHERLVQALRSHDEDQFEDCGSLIQEVLSHYEHYLMEKSKAAREQVLFFYSPPWLTSFEKTLLWVGGFKPFLLFKLLAKSVTELNPEQEQAIERVKYETRKGERELTETSATIQESLAALPLLNLVSACGRAVDGEESDLESEIEKLKVELHKVLERADKLRGSTVTKLLQILNPVQTLKFLAASAELSAYCKKMWFAKRPTENNVIGDRDGNIPEVSS